MSAVPTASSIPAPPMANPTGMGRVWLSLDAEALRWGRQAGLGGIRYIIGASTRDARVRPIPNSA